MRIVLTPQRLFDIEADLFLLPFFEDERPLKGTAGWVDWHEAGRLSRLLLDGHVKGAPEDRLLYVAEGLFRTRAMLLFGLGSSRDFSYYRIFKVYQYLAETLRRLAGRRFILGLPGRLHGETEAGRLVDRMIQGLADGSWKDLRLLEGLSLMVAVGSGGADELYVALQRTRGELAGRVAVTVARWEEAESPGRPLPETAPAAAGAGAAAS
ncbi:MAG: hypothetical protein HYY13_04075 [Nitrospirae bacterium]|nr:hypothetical protein [Nitrospirota bacterium]